MEVLLRHVIWDRYYLSADPNEADAVSDVHFVDLPTPPRLIRIGVADTKNVQHLCVFVEIEGLHHLTLQGCESQTGIPQYVSFMTMGNSFV